MKKTTSRRITQNTLQADSEEKLRLILEAVSEAIVVTDLNGKIQQANRAALISYGYTGNAEFTGQSALRYVIFSDRHKLLKNIRQIRQSGIPHRRIHSAQARRLGLSRAVQHQPFKKFSGTAAGFCNLYTR